MMWKPSPTVIRALRPLLLLLAFSWSSAYGAYWLWMGPAGERLAQALQAYEGARRKAAALDESRTQQERMKQKAATLDVFWKTLPSRDRFSALAVSVSELGRREKVAIPGMTHSIGKTKDQLPVKGTLKFSAVGEYDAVYRFIHRLELVEPYLVIEGLDASRTAKGNLTRATHVQLNISLVTYLQADAPKRSS